jgi:parallel beta-helix repeat protein
MRALIPIFAFLLFAVPSQARTITVDDNIPADFDNIQDAINDSNDGDIIVVGPGTYTGYGNHDIDFDGKAITVRSMDANDPDIVSATIIDCNGTEDEPRRGFYFYRGEDENSIIDGFTITGGYISGDIMAIFPPFDGGGIYCDWSSPTIRNCIIRANTAWDYGGGIYCVGSNPTIRNCIIIENTAGSDGGAIFISWVEGESTSHITNCTIAENYAENNGGGIWTNDYVTIANSIITDNTSGGDGGGLYLAFPGQDIINSTITGNSAGYLGGGIYGCKGWEGLIFEITNCILWANVAPGGSEIALKNDGTLIPAELTVCYSDIESCVDCVFVEDGCILNWCESNIDDDPMFVDPYNPVPNERDYHLLLNSPCINEGCDNPNDPNCDYTGQTDIDGQPRVMAGRVDMGADEFNPGIYNMPQDTYYLTIQAAIDAAENGDTIIIEDGTYVGEGNRELNFWGKAITLRSQNGPDNCIIDCEQLSTGFIFINSEEANSVVDGFTITNGYSLDAGGGILCESSSPTINNCIISSNTADRAGGGISCWAGNPTITNCSITGNQALTETGGGIWCSASSEPIISNSTISENSPDGIWMDDMSNAWITGTVQVIYNNLTGSGTVQVQSDAILLIHDSAVSCTIAGIGTVQVPVGKELIIENDAVVDLVSEDPNIRGTIQCDGMLRVKDTAQVSNANINTVFASFEGSSVISNNVITTKTDTTYGQLAARDTAVIIDNVFNADGDRYIDINPLSFAGKIEPNYICVTITEGTNNTPPALFELRGLDMFCYEPPCEPGLYQLESVPDFDPNTWTIDRLEVLDGAKVTFTNRFDFQPPYDSDGEQEVLYVKHLILGQNSSLNIGLNHLYCETFEGDPNVITKYKPPMGFLLDDTTFDSEFEFEIDVTTNNVYGPYPMIFVERVEGLEPDPCGVMRMSNKVVLDPCSPNYLQMVNARAKGLFAKASEDRILIRFKYLFETSNPNAGLDIYISDVPDLIAPDDPNRMEHNIKVAYVPAPPPGLPGSAGSGRFGVFQMTVSPEYLDFTDGMWIELELIEPAGGEPLAAAHTGFEMSNGDTAVLADDVGVEIQCSGYCMDFNWSWTATESDFLIAIVSCGLPASLDSNATDSLFCLDGFFSVDGFVDQFDIISWDWALESGDAFNDYCGVHLGETAATAGASAGDVGVVSASNPSVSIPDSLRDLLIVGKRGTSNDKLKGRLYVFDCNGVCMGWSEPESDRCNIRVVKDREGNLYQLNSEAGVLRLDETNEVIIPPGRIPDVNEPRYNKAAVVYVGLQGTGQDAIGRPIFDAAFDTNFVYVVPVVVDPNDPNEKPYAAAAKLQLLESGNPPYQLMQLYDEIPPTGTSQYRNNLRDIELDAEGNVYVVNTHRINENDTVWKYSPDGTKISLSLGNPTHPNDYLPDPIGMCVSNTAGMLYLASGQYNPAGINSTVVHGLSLEDLAPKRTITVNGMHHVADITEEPTTGSLWIVGFNMDSFPPSPNPGEPAFYHPCLANVAYDSNTAQAVSIYDPNIHDLALPISIVWTKPVKCGGADIDGDGKVTLKDFAVLVSAWLTELGDTGWNSDCNISDPADAFIDARDLVALVRHWLETGCL